MRQYCSTNKFYSFLFVFLNIFFSGSVLYGEEITDLNIGIPLRAQEVSIGTGIYYRIPVSVGEHIFVLLNKDDSFRCYLSIAEGHLPEQTSNSTYADQAVELKAESSGYAYVLVKFASTNPSSGTFTITAHNENTFPSLVLGVTTEEQTLMHEGSALYYRIPVATGEHVFALLHKSVGFNTYLSIDAGQIPPRATKYSGADQSVEIVAPAKGYVYVRVECASKGNQTFSLTAYNEDTFPRLANGVPLGDQSLPHFRSAQWYQIDVDTGEHIFALINKDEDFRDYISIAEGHLPERAPNYSDTDQVIELTAESNGYVYILVEFASKNPSSGTFTITASTFSIGILQGTIGVCQNTWDTTEYSQAIAHIESIGARIVNLQDWSELTLENVDAIFVPTPKEPFTENEAKTLADFYENGGSLFILDDWGKSPEEWNAASEQILNIIGLEEGGNPQGGTPLDASVIEPHPTTCGPVGCVDTVGLSGNGYDYFTHLPDYAIPIAVDQNNRPVVVALDRNYSYPSSGVALIIGDHNCFENSGNSERSWTENYMFWDNGWIWLLNDDQGKPIISPTRSGKIYLNDSLRFTSEAKLFKNLKWDFGDNRISTVSNPGLITFSTAGERNVALEVYNDQDNTIFFSDSRTITVEEEPNAVPDFIVDGLNIPAHITVGQPITITYSVSNRGSMAVSGASWHDALYLSKDMYLDTLDVLSGSVQVTRNVPVAGTYQGSIPITIPPILEGTYYLILSVDNKWSILEQHQLNNEYAVLANITVPILENGMGQNVTVTTGRVAHYYRVDVRSGENLFIALDTTLPCLTIYAKFDALPTRGTYDYRAMDSNLLIPAATAGTWYILIYCDSISEAGEYAIVGQSTSVKIQSITPSRHLADMPLTLTINGAGFTGETQVALEGIGKALHPASEVEVNSFSKITATWETGVPIGVYNVVVSVTNGSDALDTGFEAYAGELGRVETNLVLPSRVGYHELATIYVEYKNVGDSTIQAPLLELTATQNEKEGAFLTLEETRLSRGFWTSAIPKGFAHTVQFMASGTVPGVLQPGESGRVPVYYTGWKQPWDFSYPPITWTVSVLDDTITESIDWTSLKAEMRPYFIREDAWEAIWANFTVQVGDTWGDYGAMLADNANYLGQLGYREEDVSQLLALEFRKAEGLNPLSYLGTAVDALVQAPGIPIVFSRSFGQPISRRYELGPLGRGWRHNWEFTVTKEEDGTVIIMDMTGTPRIFQPDGRHPGTYLAQPGDYGKLTDAAGGNLILRETDGFQSAFTSDGKLAFVEDTNKNRITCGYSGDLLTSLTHSSGQSLSLGYSGGYISSVKDSLGRETVLLYSGEHLDSATTYDNRTTAYTYSSGGGVKKEHALTQTTFPGGLNVNFAYDDNGRLSSLFTDDTLRIDFTYDTSGRVIATDVNNNSSQFYFNNWGQVVKAANPFGDAVYFTFDKLRNLIAVTDPAGYKNCYDYDNRGNVVLWTDANGAETRFAYAPSLNRLTRLTDANGNKTQYDYFEENGNLRSITYANGTRESWTYDDFGNPTTWTNRRGNSVNYAYDYRPSVGGKLSQKNFSSDPQMDYVYDNRGNLIRTVDVHGSTEYGYYPDDHLKRIDFPGGQWLEFTYDNTGRRASSLDQLGHLLEYHYDGLGRLHLITDEMSAIIVRYEYDTAGRLALKTMGNGVYATYEYDEAGQLVLLANFQPDGTPLSFFGYAYDSRGRRIQMNTHYGNWSYEYDDMGQLTHAVLSSTSPDVPNQDLRYVYDPLGNRKHTVINGVREDYITNNMNQYEQVGDKAYLFDGDGNLIKESSPVGTIDLIFNDDNQLISVMRGTDSWQYLYNALGKRICCVENSISKNFIIDPIGFGNVVGEYNNENVLKERYDHGLGLVKQTDASDYTLYFAFDDLGNTSDLTGVMGTFLNDYAYSPFNRISSSHERTTNHLYNGEWGITNESNALDYMRARFYNSHIGRFISEDPLGILGGINSNNYAVNNPVLFSDPSGLINEPQFIMGCWQASSGFAVVASGVAIVAAAPAVVSLGTAAAVTAGAAVLIAGTYDITMGIAGRIIPALFDSSIIDNMPAWTLPGLLSMPFTSNPSMVDTIYGIVTVPLPGVGIGGAALGASSLIAGGIVVPWINSITSSIQDSSITGALDPNIKSGPSGFGLTNYTDGDKLFPYRIDFENDSEATAPAQVVYVWDSLSTDLDMNTLELTEIGFGDTSIAVPQGLQYYETTVPMTYQEVNFEVKIEAGLRSTNEVFINFYSIDPETELPPNGGIGFLPPEDGTGRGQGHLSYVVRAREGLASGTEIRNVANIQFSFGEIIATNQVDPHDSGQGTDPEKEALITIDNGIPTSHALQLPEESNTLSFEVAWTGADEPGGSGIASYDIWAQDNGGPWQVWLQKVTAESDTFTGENNHTYCFYTLATDNVGHQETKAPVSETSIHVVAPVEGEGEPSLEGEGESSIEGEPPVGQVIVPDVTGKPKDESVVLLEALGFQVIVQEENSKAPRDEVVAQDPAAGGEVARGTSVTLTVSTGDSGSLCGCGPQSASKGGYQGDLILLLVLSVVLAVSNSTHRNTNTNVARWEKVKNPR